MGIFDKRVNFKPFEYPEVLDFVDKMNKTFWVHSEVEFTSDIQNFHAHLSAQEKEVVKRSLLSIAQVEVAVKTFWGDLYDHLPKPEFNGLGATFAECEHRHAMAYSQLLEVLGYNDEFAALLEIPVFRRKLDLLEEHFQSKKTFVERLLFFVIVIENASLFSQFANILSFTHFRGYLRNTSNIIAWTSIDEQTHADAGVYLLRLIFQEHPELRPSQEQVEQTVQAYLSYEIELLNWIYEEGELSFFSRENLLDFMKYRVDTALEQIGYSKIYNISEEAYKPMLWFDEDVFANELDDFFAKRPTAYTKHDKAFTADSLF